jgi:hypothetical protein
VTVGTHRATFGTSDVSCEVLEATVRHGRDNPVDQPAASSATIGLPVALPPGVDVGTAVTLDTETAPGTWVRRFTGKVTDLSASWEGGDVRPVSAVLAVGPLADLGRSVVGDAPFPQELDGARAARILALAGATTGRVDPGTVQLLPRDVDARAALELLTAVAEDGAGILWETRTGQVSYSDALARHGVPVTVLLDACDVLLAPTWSRTVAGLVNDVTIRYGPTPDGGEQPSYTANRPDSVAAFGRFAYSTTTELAALADVTDRAQLLLVRGGLPVWNMPELPVNVADLDPARTAALLALDVGGLLGLTGLPAGSPATSVNLWVEGWTEHLAHGVHDLVLAVSAYCRTAPPPLWNNIDPAVTWDTVGTMTWNDATCMGPLPSAGRWADVPASLRWDEIAPAVTWDTWS